MSTAAPTLAARRAEHARRLRAAAAEIASRLGRMPQVRRVSLFGSFARGRDDLFTDLDVLVVMDTKEPPLERVRRIYAALALPVDLDLLVQRWSTLDGYYVPTRYLDGLPDSIPARVYTREAAAEAVKMAGEMVDFVRQRIGTTA